MTVKTLDTFSFDVANGTVTRFALGDIESGTTLGSKDVTEVVTLLLATRKRSHEIARENRANAAPAKAAKRSETAAAKVARLADELAAAKVAARAAEKARKELAKAAK